jgi:ABC-type microcin C transport system duplicated ATPase subunit YejF
VSFSLDRGKTLAIVGESGSGKSVTASSVIRLLAKTGKIEDGSIEFDGIDMVHVPERELLKLRGSDISMIFQDPMSGLDPVFKVGTQMVELIRAHSDLGKKEAYDRAVEMLRLVGIPDPEARMDAYPYELSGGMCQRVIIAYGGELPPQVHHRRRANDRTRRYRSVPGSLAPARTSGRAEHGHSPHHPQSGHRVGDGQ